MRARISPGQTLQFSVDGGRFPGRIIGITPRNMVRFEVVCLETPRRGERRRRRRGGARCGLVAGVEIFNSETGETSVASRLGVPARLVPPDDVGMPGRVPGPGQ